MEVKSIKNEEQNEIVESRNQLVVKSNTIIQKARFDLTTQEQKIILFLISKIKPEDEDFTNQRFDISEFCKVCGIDYDNGKNYKNIKETIKKLSTKNAWVELDEDVDVLLSWINGATIYKKSGIVKLRLSEDMKPFLLELKKNFTQYEILYTLAMKSQYSIRLYEILRSYAYKGRWIVEIEELKRMLTAETYERFPDFKRKVLDISMRELKTFSDLKVSYQIIKEGRRYAKIEFSIKQKIDTNERVRTWANIDNVLHPQINMFDNDNVEDNNENH